MAHSESAVFLHTLYIRWCVRLNRVRSTILFQIMRIMRFCGVPSEAWNILLGENDICEETAILAQRVAFYRSTAQNTHSVIPNSPSGVMEHRKARIIPQFLRKPQISVQWRTVQYPIQQIRNMARALNLLNRNIPKFNTRLNTLASRNLSATG